MDETGRNPFHLAVDKGHLPIVEYLISVGADPNIYTGEGWNSLHIAVKNNYISIVKYLMINGMDVFGGTIVKIGLKAHSAASLTNSFIIKFLYVRC